MDDHQDVRHAYRPTVVAWAAGVQGLAITFRRRAEAGTELAQQ
jgi:hypothetical protein